MAKKLNKGGLKLVAGGPGRRPMVWRVTAPGLSRTYTFTPGVVTYVDPEDEGWFADPDNTEGRVFEVVPAEADPASSAAPGAERGVRERPDVSTPAAAAAAVESVVSRTRRAAGLDDKPTPDPGQD